MNAWVRMILRLAIAGSGETVGFVSSDGGSSRALELQGVACTRQATQP